MKKSILAAVAAATALAAPAVLAQNDFPSKPIRMIVTFPPGGSTDLIARVMAPVMSKNLGQQVVVENKGGAGGNIGAEAVARSAPDGYTLVFSGAGALGINSVLYRSMPFNPVKDLAPVSLVATSPFVLVGPANSPYKDVQALLADAKASPGKLSLGHGGQGTVMHLASELFNQLGQVKTVLVPYKGTGPATTDALAGQIPLAMSDTPSAVPYIKEGRLKAFAVTTSERSSSLPDVPTLAEAGMKGYEAMGWFAIAVPAGTPDPIIKRLNQAITAALNDPQVIERVRAAGADPSPTSPEELQKLIATDIAKWGDIVKQVGLNLN
ncbi:MAG: tripartite tricarboxylate transporter substrate binding protein [Pigmentiphaga sp.]|uniref:Bug family tripartite tricarboxylate transporter substrate binding protein n=1 Tax=Pigmentiphaga sp. TaxID=1977564 RepID=UPI0029A49A95|nr:tripartite tricarboxylate transporter substrate binding protein [Pigmentiphaga sp.]MDX3905224.1 tripartite tricarboxylate transporter substrate binding protein [Pigmentiphaga sp.]